MEKVLLEPDYHKDGSSGHPYSVSKRGNVKQWGVEHEETQVTVQCLQVPAPSPPSWATRMLWLTTGSGSFHSFSQELGGEGGTQVESTLGDLITDPLKGHTSQRLRW